jgi:hypothetical protein
MCRRDDSSAWGQFFQFEPPETVPFFIRTQKVDAVPKARLALEAFEPEEFKVPFSRAKDHRHIRQAGAV